jgi:hypothetical protein
MGSTPEQPAEVFSVRFYEPMFDKWQTTHWKMTREDAAKIFAGREYEILEDTKEVLKPVGNPYRNSMAFLGDGPKRKEE